MRTRNHTFSNKDHITLILHTAHSKKAFVSLTTGVSEVCGIKYLNTYLKCIFAECIQYEKVLQHLLFNYQTERLNKEDNKRIEMENGCQNKSSAFNT